MFLARDTMSMWRSSRVMRRRMIPVTGARKPTARWGCAHFRPGAQGFAEGAPAGLLTIVALRPVERCHEAVGRVRTSPCFICTRTRRWAGARLSEKSRRLAGRTIEMAADEAATREQTTGLVGPLELVGNLRYQPREPFGRNDVGKDNVALLRERPLRLFDVNRRSGRGSACGRTCGSWAARPPTVTGYIPPGLATRRTATAM
jgi:hypothetical protein